MEYRYRNPWAKPTDTAEYVRQVAPVEYNGFLLFHVYPQQWDTVKNGVCIAQRITRSGAEHAADLVTDLLFPTFEDVRARWYKEIEG